MFALPGVRIGPHAGCSGLTVFPLFAASPGGRVSYLLGDEAIEEGLVTVEEIGESGSVPNLLVGNRPDSRVLFVEGEELVGAKQNRILNSTVLLAPKSETIRKAETLPWERFDPVGEGEEFRCDSPSGDQGAALVLEGVMVHGSLVAQD